MILSYFVLWNLLLLILQSQAFVPHCSSFTRIRTKLHDVVDENDWRAFRAKLISQEQQQATPLNQGYCHDHFNLEPGLILIHTPRPQDVYGLGRQGLYQSLVLILLVTAKETRGIVLQRPLVPSTTTFHGGEDYGIRSQHPFWSVLILQQDHHHMSLGYDILPGLVWARLQDTYKATQAADSILGTYAGYESWDTAELQSEVSRGIWKGAVMDALTLKDLVWRKDARKELFKKLGQATVETPSSLNPFDARMHQEWCRAHLQVPSMTTTDQQVSASPAPLLRPGDLLVSCRDSFLLFQQEFHGCFLLLLQFDEDMVVGLILNHPTTESEDLTGLPVRYGGDFGVSPPFCIYHGPLDIGERVGRFCKASVQQADCALRQGLVNTEDFMVVQGLSVWERQEFDSLYFCFEKLEDDIVISNIWHTLGHQVRLSPLAMEGNVDLARQAWTNASPGGEELSDLGMDAVKTWLAVYFLKDSDYRP